MQNWTKFVCSNCREVAEENARDEVDLGGSERGGGIKDGVEEEGAGDSKREVNEQAKEIDSEDSSKEKKDSGPRYAGPSSVSWVVLESCRGDSSGSLQYIVYGDSSRMRIHDQLISRYWSSIASSRPQQLD